MKKINFNRNQRLKKQKSFFSNRFDDFYIILDADGVITEIHETSELRDLFKWSNICIGSTYDQCEMIQEMKSVIDVGLNYIKNKGEPYKINFSINKGKITHDFELTFLKRHVHKKSDEGFVVIGRDVTAEKSNETELKSHVDELENVKKAMFNLLEDMDEEKKSSLALVKEMEKFKRAVDASSDHIQITDPNGLIIYVNDAVEKITGYTREESIGKKSSELWGGRMDKDFYNRFWKTLKEDKLPFSAEVSNHRKNGEGYIAEIQIYPILGEDHQPLFYVGIERDITRLKEVDKMKSEFVSVASHQLRTPLSAIKWLTELLLDGSMGELTADQKDFLSQIMESNQRMIKLVNDLLDISHIETGRKFNIVKTKTDIVGLIQSVLKEQFITAKKKNIEFVFQKRMPKKLEVNMDGEKVIQVIQNFVSNGIKYSDSKKEIMIDLSVKNKEVIFMVKNFGVYIKSSEAKNIFEKFYRTDDAKLMDPLGSGLGLYIAKAIIENHGGKIWFTSTPKGGTSFYFSLPMLND